VRPAAAPARLRAGDPGKGAGHGITVPGDPSVSTNHCEIRSDGQGYVIRDLNLNPKQFPPRSVHARISALKNEGTSAADFAEAASVITERKVAETKKAEVAHLLKQNVAVEVLDAQTFWPAEDYHQDYYIKNPIRYKYYRWGSGRDQFLEKTWGKKD
jgi:hypothetical protein